MQFYAIFNVILWLSPKHVIEYFLKSFLEKLQTKITYVDMIIIALKKSTIPIRARKSHRKIRFSSRQKWKTWLTVCHTREARAIARFSQLIITNVENFVAAAIIFGRMTYVCLHTHTHTHISVTFFPLPSVTVRWTFLMIPLPRERLRHRMESGENRLRWKHSEKRWFWQRRQRDLNQGSMRATLFAHSAAAHNFEAFFRVLSLIQLTTIVTVVRLGSILHTHTHMWGDC